MYILFIIPLTKKRGYATDIPRQNKTGNIHTRFSSKRTYFINSLLLFHFRKIYLKRPVK